MVAAAGCAKKDRPARVEVEPEIVLLDESEFDEFAGRVAEALTASLAARDGATADAATTRLVAGPRPAADDGASQHDVQALAAALAAGLNDRMSGRAVFRESAADAATLTAELSLSPAENGAKSLTLVVREAGTSDALVRESILVQPPPVLAEAPPRRSAGARAGEPQRSPRPSASRSHTADRQSDENADSREGEKPRRRKINIDADPRGLLEFIREQAPWNAQRTLGDPGGETIFVDDGAWKRHRLLGQHTQRTADGRLRVELDFRARQRRGDANLRVVLMDEAGSQIEVTPVLPYRFLPDYTTTVVVTSVSKAAAGYVCLIDD
ncbi:hypothetical protein RAS1_05560 [Phycisphaerae bacterium RAS1]|nr:hypothetical protein RAS1_05560 [Phycisphaerae bacterium RAS1]